MVTIRCRSMSELALRAFDRVEHRAQMRGRLGACEQSWQAGVRGEGWPDKPPGGHTSPCTEPSFSARTAFRTWPAEPNVAI
jgi:hypothetical protein